MSGLVQHNRLCPFVANVLHDLVPLGQGCLTIVCRIISSCLAHILGFLHQRAASGHHIPPQHTPASDFRCAEPNAKTHLPLKAGAEHSEA
jgi:hypothetical protein